MNGYNKPESNLNPNLEISQSLGVKKSFSYCSLKSTFTELSTIVDYYEKLVQMQGADG
jgi:hypothetical protein